jgi:flagellar motor switch protein FliM
VDASAPAPNPEPFDFQGANRLSPNQITKLLELHAEFAKRLGRSLSTLLGPECKTNPMSVELMTYGDLFKEPSEGALFETLRIQSPEGTVVLQADLASVLPMIDLLLGGAGTAAETIRPLTEIEREIFKPIIAMVAGELQAAWAPFLETSLRYEHCGAAANLLPANESVSSVKFEIQIGELRGTWILILPMMVSNALTRKLEQEASRADPDRSEQNQRRLKERLLDSRFLMELFLPPSGLSVRKLAHLKTGQVLVLKTRSTDPIQFQIAGIHLFQAVPVSCGARRGAQIKRTLSMVKSQEKEAR